jgi:hypothetical protein
MYHHMNIGNYYITHEKNKIGNNGMREFVIKKK